MTSGGQKFVHFPAEKVMKAALSDRFLELSLCILQLWG